MLRDGDIVTATPKVMSVLLVLVKAAGQPVAKDDLIQAVWPDSFVEDGNLIQNISVLRKLMAQDYPDGSAVETIARFGYRFRPEVHVLHGPVWDKQESERKKEGLASEACVSEDPPPGPDEEKVQTSQTGSSAEEPRAVSPTKAAPAWGQRSMLVGAAVTLLCAATLAIVVRHRLRTSVATARRDFQAIRFTSNSSSEWITTAAISPDGSSVVFAEPHQLHIRSVKGAAETRAILPIRLWSGQDAIRCSLCYSLSFGFADSAH